MKINITFEENERHHLPVIVAFLRGLLGNIRTKQVEGKDQYTHAYISTKRKS